MSVDARKDSWDGVLVVVLVDPGIEEGPVKG